MSDYEFVFECTALLSTEADDPEAARDELSEQLSVPASTLELHSASRLTEDGPEALSTDQQRELFEEKD